MPTLTVAGVARVKPPKHGQVDHFDRGYPGLALRVSYGGARAWVYFYRLHGKQHRLTLGRFPAMGLDEAREAWRVARLAVAKGESPTHARPTAADSFAAVAGEWLERDQAQNRSVAEVRRVIERDVFPAWGDRPITGIGRRDINELIDGVADRGAMTMARRLHAHLHRLFRWAVGRGIIETNPMADLPKPGAAVKRDRVLTNTELAAVWGAAGKAGGPFGPAIRLLALTAARRDEIASMRWSEVHGDEIRIPASRSKNGETHLVPLVPAAAKLLENMPRIGEDGFVFTTTGKTPVSGWSKAKRALDVAAAELYGRPLPAWRLHDLRRTAATGMQRLGVGLQVVESVLGHVAGSRAGIVGVYQQHRFEAEKRAALEAWAHEIDRIVHGGAGSYVITPPSAPPLGLSPSAPTIEIQSINTKWLVAIKHADIDNSFEPLLKFLCQPRVKLGESEIFWLRNLLERLQFKRKVRGNFVALGQKSQQDIHEAGAAHVRELQQTGLSRADAIDRVVLIYPDWFKSDAGASLANFMKRG